MTDAVTGQDGLRRGAPMPAGATLARRLAVLLDDADRGLRADRQAAERLIADASRLLTAGEGAAANGGGLAPWQLRRVTAHIAASLETKLYVADLAALARLSPWHFSRAFKASLGLSPHAYVLERRIERAQHLMRTTADPLAQIALACGLADQAHLSRLFQKVAGVAPSRWRREYGMGG
jgi:transcriptional regulator GlxA family with amidase domain